MQWFVSLVHLWGVIHHLGGSLPWRAGVLVVFFYLLTWSSASQGAVLVRVLAADRGTLWDCEGTVTEIETGYGPTLDPGLLVATNNGKLLSPLSQKWQRGKKKHVVTIHCPLGPDRSSSLRGRKGFPIGAACRKQPLPNMEAETERMGGEEISQSLSLRTCPALSMVFHWLNPHGS